MMVLLLLAACPLDSTADTSAGTSDTAATEDSGCTPTTWYTDADGDGYGDRDAPVQACGPGDGRVETSGDCDDQDARVNPAAPETCDGVDDDCDALTDELPAYSDNDGDGHGDPRAAVPCAEGVPAGDDCDDTDPASFPGADEVCGDGVDNDCDGAVDGGCDALHADDDALVRFTGEARNDQAGYSAGFGDFDGDGAVDAAVGAGNHVNGNGTVATVYVVPGPLSGAVSLSSVATRLLPVDARLDVVGVNDADGDGVSDLWLRGDSADSASSNFGALFRTSGLPTGEQTATSVASLVLVGPSSTLPLRQGVVLDDVDGDARPDIGFLTGPGHGGGWTFGWCGGTLTGAQDTSCAVTQVADDGSGTFLDPQVHLLSDLDGDGLGELVVHDSAASEYAGALAVLTDTWRSADTDVSDAATQIHGAEAYDQVGIAFCATDWNGDGTNDLALATPTVDGTEADTGGVFLLLGPLTSGTPDGLA